jgi:hypothetical protein
MDSEAERDTYSNLRNLQHTTNRFYRSVIAGVSKCSGSGLSIAIRKHKSTNDNLPTLFDSNIIDFCLHAKSWCYSGNEKQSLWKLNQWQPGQPFRMGYTLSSVGQQF